MGDFQDLTYAISAEIHELKEALAAKKRADAAKNPDTSGLPGATQKYLGLQFQLDQKLRKRGLRGGELETALKAIMEIVQKG